ncbi:hypothetical protein EBZ39_03100 [bacterium]|nr:hypothetical protein [bacterium]
MIGLAFWYAHAASLNWPSGRGLGAGGVGGNGSGSGPGPGVGDGPGPGGVTPSRMSIVVMTCDCPPASGNSTR